MITRYAPIAALALAGCASSIRSTDSASYRHSTVADASTVAPVDGASCDPPAALTPAPACASLPELAAPENAVARAVFAFDDPAPTRNTARPSCLGEPWQDRADVRLRFTAPRGGRWRFRATGEELWALDLTRGCATAAACTGFPDVHGPFASGAHTVDVQVERGETLGVTLDGCPEGVDCRYALRVERVADLACEFGLGTPAVCPGEREVCAVNACDPERFECVPVASRSPTLTSLRALASASRRQALYVGRASLGDPSRLRRGATMFIRWLDARGAALAPMGYEGNVVVGLDGSFASLGREVPPGAVRGRFWFYDGSRPEGEGAVEAAVERWTPPREGEACATDLLAERCDQGLRCVTDGTSPRGTCRRASALEVSRVRAWRDDGRGSLRVAVEGFGAGAPVSQLSLEALDDRGSVLASAPRVAAVFAHEPPSGVPFATSIEVSNGPNALRPSGIDRSFVVSPAMVRLRVAATDTGSRRSEAVEVAVRPTVEAPLGARCDDPSVACAAGLTCAEQSGADHPRCEPTRPARGCGIQGWTPTWAPPAAPGEYTVEGVAHAVGGGPSCYIGRTQRVTAMEFVAPVSGRYAFTLRGLRALGVGTGCEAQTCVVAPAGSDTAEVAAAMTAGQRVVLELSSDREATGAAAFSLSVRVP
ncbi:MAG: hypothetical protein R3A48_25220 [Polyangiales bacterium]